MCACGKVRSRTWPVLACFSLAMGAVAGQVLPPIGQLAGQPASGGQVALAWDTPLFEDPDPAPGFDSVLEFRCSNVEINNSNWNTAWPIAGEIPPIAVNAGWAIQLTVDAQPITVNGTVYLDVIYMRAWLTVWVNVGNLVPFGYPLSGETIQFSVWDQNGQYVTGGSDDTDNTGMADFHTGDLNPATNCNQPNWPLYAFKARWNGRSIGLSSGSIIISTGAREATENMMVCNGTYTLPPAGVWGRFGGIYHYCVGETAYEFWVPVDAVMVEAVPVQVYLPSYVPPPIGMNPGVPGAMTAVMVEKADGPYLGRPVTITAEYPSAMLEQYGGLGESSLRAYRYDQMAQSWIPLNIQPVTIDRVNHRFRFTTDQLGLLALAAEIDPDHDGLGLFEEMEAGLNPDLPDSDGDSLSDGHEVWFTRSDPLDPRKTSAEDQTGLLLDLNPGQRYYVAGRIICGDLQSDVSNCIYVQAGGQHLGDVNCDRLVNAFDIDPFVLALTDANAYAAAYPNCSLLNADCNQDGQLNAFDIDPFVELLTGN